MLKRLMTPVAFTVLLAVLLSGCRSTASRSDPDPGHRHAEEVGEIKLPNGQ